jgi:hypothetical protein
MHFMHQNNGLISCKRWFCKWGTLGRPGAPFAVQGVGLFRYRGGVGRLGPQRW